MSYRTLVFNINEIWNKSEAPYPASYKLYFLIDTFKNSL